MYTDPMDLGLQNISSIEQQLNPKEFEIQSNEFKRTLDDVQPIGNNKIAPQRKISGSERLISDKKNLVGRQKIMQKFMDSMESDLGIQPQRIVESMLKLPQHELIKNPSETATQIVEALNLDPIQENKAIAIFQKLLQELNTFEEQQSSFDKFGSINSPLLNGDIYNVSPNNNWIQKGEIKKFPDLMNNKQIVKNIPMNTPMNDPSLSNISNMDEIVRTTDTRASDILKRKNSLQLNEAYLEPGTQLNSVYASGINQNNSHYLGDSALRSSVEDRRISDLSSYQDYNMNLSDSTHSEKSYVPNDSDWKIQPELLENSKRMSQALDKYLGEPTSKVDLNSIDQQAKVLDEFRMLSDQVTNGNLGEPRALPSGNVLIPNSFESNEDLQMKHLDSLDFDSEKLSAISDPKLKRGPNKIPQGTLLNSPYSIDASKDNIANSEFPSINSEFYSKLSDRENIRKFDEKKSANLSEEYSGKSHSLDPSVNQASSEHSKKEFRLDNKPEFFGTDRSTSNSTLDTRNTDNIIKQAQYVLKKGGGEAIIKLEPEGLGTLHLKVTLNEGKVQLHMAAESVDAKKVLENAMPDLRRSLDSHKMHVDKIALDVGTSIQTEATTQHHPQQNYQDDFRRQQAMQFLGQFRDQNSDRREGFQDFMETNHRKVKTQPTEHLSPEPTKRNGKGLNLIV